MTNQEMANIVGRYLALRGKASFQEIQQALPNVGYVGTALEILIADHVACIHEDGTFGFAHRPFGVPQFYSEAL